MSKMKIYCLNSTHWDREWYEPFQSFRFDLVEMIDELIDIMEKDPEYKLFCFDGQSIVAEDYAEIKPENAEKLNKLIQEGRIRLGPWYVMPDEFLPSGESLIRNLMVGDKVAKKWGGKPWKYGYVNDIFGHIAQMPQIFAGFGISGSYLGRGLGNTDFAHFNWQSPDGTSCFTTIGNYSSFARGPKPDCDSKEFKQKLRKWIDATAARSNVPIVFLSNTDDHRHADANTPKMLNIIRELYPDAEVCNTDLSEMAAELSTYKDELPIVIGELNKPLDSEGVFANNTLTLLYNCLSSHYPLKQENDICQNLLEKRIEPMIAYSEIEGNHISHNYVDVAYDFLLQNHPHDSICGCSVDQVHKDMIYRFDQTKLICNRLYDKFFEFEKDMFRKEGSGSEYELKVYNNLPIKQEFYKEVKIDFYKGFEKYHGGYAGKEGVNNFKIFDTDGNEVPYQIIKIEKNVQKRIVSIFQGADMFDVYTIGLKVTVPPCGYASYRVLPVNNKTVYIKNSIPCGNDWAENNLIRLEIANNGTLNITDKRNGKKYNCLNNYLDNGEIGDGWRYQKPMNDVTVSGIGNDAVIRKISEGIAQVKFKVTKRLIVPAYLDGATLFRSEEEKELKIDYTVTLRKDSPVVEIETEIDNNVKDHRLRVIFPTNTGSKKYFAGQSFYRVERDCGIDLDTADWLEPESVEKNMNGIIGNTDKDGNGLAIVSPEGLHEAGCNDSADISVTLYRCFDRVFMQPHAERSQLQRKLTFKYSIVPITNEDTYADLLRIQHRLANVDMTYSKRVADGSSQAKTHSYLSLENADIALSMFKCAQDSNGYVLRIFNTTGNAVNTKVNVDFDFSEAFETDMLENAIKPVKSVNNSVKVTLNPWEIKTLRFNKP